MDQVLGKVTMNIGTIQGGVVPNIIPESAVSRLSFRVVEPLEAVIERVQKGSNLVVHASPCLLTLALTFSRGWASQDRD